MDPQHKKKAAPAFLGVEDDDDNDSIAYTTAFQDHNSTGEEDDDEKPARNFLAPNGFGSPLLQTEGPAYEYLTNKQYSTRADSMEITVMKNLIVLFQNHALEEDCLIKVEGDNQTTYKRKVSQTLARIQQTILGDPEEPPNEGRVVLRMLKIYATAREDEILYYAMLGKEPPLPNSRLNALLHVLIDRYIVFSLAFKTMRVSLIPMPFQSRLDALSKLMTAALAELKMYIKNEDYATQEAPNSLFVRLLPMIPSAELQPSFTKPWFMEMWLLKHIPEANWPAKIEKVAVEDYETDSSDVSEKDNWYADLWMKKRAVQPPPRKRGKNKPKNKPKSARAPAKQAPAKNPDKSSGKEESADKDAGDKRKREDEDDDDEEHGSGADTRFKVVNKETTYYTMGELVYLPK